MKGETIVLTWDQLRIDVAAVAACLPRKFTSIVAVSRGGLVPACLVAERLGIQLIETISIKSYEDRSWQKVEVLKPAYHFSHFSNSTEETIVIDDICDTGNTMVECKRQIKNAFYAVLYAKPQGIFAVDFAARCVRQNDWVEFPWEL